MIDRSLNYGREVIADFLKKLPLIAVFLISEQDLAQTLMQRVRHAHLLRHMQSNLSL
jgi:hypothetical protein